MGILLNIVEYRVIHIQEAKMKIAVLCCLLVGAWSMAIQEDATSQCISPEKLVEEAHALQPMSDEVAFELDMLNDQGLAKRDGPPPDGGTGPGPQPGDDLLEKNHLGEAKDLRVPGWKDCRSSCRSLREAVCTKQPRHDHTSPQRWFPCRTQPPQKPRRWLPRITWKVD